MRRLALALALALTACGSTTAQGPGATTAGSGAAAEQDCHEEQVTGSAIPRRVCRTPEQVEADRKGAQDMLGGPHATGSPTPGTP
jgi:hypothetical protein